jgi:hypothetical protein
MESDGVTFEKNRRKTEKQDEQKDRTDGNDPKGNLPLRHLLQGVSFRVISVWTAPLS